MAGLALHELHVGGAGADIFGSDVFSAERFDEAAVSAEELLAIKAMGRAQDDRFSAAEGQPCQSGLVSHAAGKAQGIGESSILIGIAPQAGPAHCRAKIGVVHGDDGVKAAGRLHAAHHALVTAHRNLGDLHEPRLPTNTSERTMLDEHAPLK